MPFLGSNTALYVGQAVADLYCSDYWLPAPATPAVPAPGPAGQWPWVRLRNECVGVGWTFFALEATFFGPGVPNAIWYYLAPVIQNNRLSVMDGGHFLFPLAQQVPVAPQFSVVSGQLVLGYLIPWGHSATVTHTVYPAPGNVWHYHSHHPRPAGTHFSTTPIDVGPRRRHAVFPAMNYGVQAQFYRYYN